MHGIETKFDSEMAAMTRVPWSTLESVGDQSEYVNYVVQCHLQTEILVMISSKLVIFPAAMSMA